ncbi:MAG: 2-oxoglutarate dehydrogenase E1 component [Gammaproteobacteria bacterium]|nr:2-oxoglutarate dehydrogenase E1 component [Gammaproteobacteria bacterium]MDE2346868.1 2-oxoglutarate dehydrogenase E1 component [Gammaproteobacteria bacterium]
MNQSIDDLTSTTLLYGGNAAFVEDLYERFLADPESVDPAWRGYFAGIAAGAQDIAHGPVRARLADASRRPAPAGPTPTGSDENAVKQGAVSRLIQVYANRGHLVANLDPLGLQRAQRPAVLELGYYGLDEADLETEFHTGSRTAELPARAKLKDIIALLRFIYTDTIGAEFAHVSDTEQRLWLQDNFQSARVKRRFSADEKRNILWQLTAAEGLERYLHTKYVGQKRFSLEGGDSLIPLLDDLVQQGGIGGVEETIIGMAHRGRLNVLVNLLGKAPRDLFSEFEGQYDPLKLRGSGDVKYHKGFSSDLKTPAGNVHVALAFNPSHLEVVNAVVEGSARARQERRGDATGVRVLPVQIHGDAAFAGQGVVMETLQLSQARGFFTGGTIHVIINNQVGFTTSDPRDARSTLYCSDVAKMIEAPIFHVNADDPEAVCFVARLALDYRMHFHKDVVIDLVCYRRHGHNEADEPSATQPLMYQVIRKKPTVRERYAGKLAAEGTVSAADAEAMIAQYREGLDQGHPQARAALGLIGNQFTVDWSRYLGADWSEPVKTGVDLPRLRALGRAITTYPREWTLHPRVLAIMTARTKMVAGEQDLDWGCAENLAYASLVQEGYPVRLTGQDSGRGTFFHRHAVLHDQSTGRSFTPLEHISPDQPKFTVTDSVLSEEAVMGFEYGFSTTEPHCLTIWEGQFGDFCNGAQVIIDQFISSGEAKWGRLSGLSLFLPHGYEGQGPEHSSARLERFLQLCAEYNMQVCVPSTPAQLFHMIRRQMVRELRKPLIVMMPKSLLRHPLSVSRLEDLAAGTFRNVIDEIDELRPAGVTRVVFCSGKVYFDLLKARREAKTEHVAIVRIEQLYPFPSDEYEAIIRRYPNAREIVWCQEEPQNQGAWYQIRHRLQANLGPKDELLYAGRAGAAAPATGIPALHDQQQKNLVTAALHGIPPEEASRHTMRLPAKTRTGS